MNRRPRSASQAAPKEVSSDEQARRRFFAWPKGLQRTPASRLSSDEEDRCILPHAEKDGHSGCGVTPGVLQRASRACRRATVPIPHGERQHSAGDAHSCHAYASFPYPFIPQPACHLLPTHTGVQEASLTCPHSDESRSPSSAQARPRAPSTYESPGET